jgi:hypothetical protein
VRTWKPQYYRPTMMTLQLALSQRCGYMFPSGFVSFRESFPQQAKLGGCNAHADKVIVAKFRGLERICYDET